MGRAFLVILELLGPLETTTSKFGVLLTIWVYFPEGFGHMGLDRRKSNFLFFIFFLTILNRGTRGYWLYEVGLGFIGVRGDLCSSHCGCSKLSDLHLFGATFTFFLMNFLSILMGLCRTGCQMSFYRWPLWSLFTLFGHMIKLCSGFILLKCLVL